jgi:hypothetical protein
MPDPQAALATQPPDIEKRTGHTLAELAGLVRGRLPAKHGELVAFLEADLGMGHGDANTLVHHVLKSDGASAAAEAGGDLDPVLDGIYGGPKAALRPIHDAVMARLASLGAFEVAPKKGYLSLRRKKQFAMLGPGSQTRVDLGLNLKDAVATERLKVLPPGGMCQAQVRLTQASEVHDELMAWVRRAFDAAG